MFIRKKFYRYIISNIAGTHRHVHRNTASRQTMLRPIKAPTYPDALPLNAITKGSLNILNFISIRRVNVALGPRCQQPESRETRMEYAGLLSNR